MNRTWVLFPIALLAATCLVVWNHATIRSRSGSTHGFRAIAKLSDFTENFVHVTVFLERDVQGHAVLQATFKPTESGFHLYSKDLPEAGVKGVGLPTRLSLVPSTALAAVGPLFADVSPSDVQIDALDLKLPVYPDGAVTLRQFVRFTAKGGGFPAECRISYVSCQTNGTCHLPVKDKVVQIPIPQLEAE